MYEENPVHEKCDVHKQILLQKEARKRDGMWSNSKREEDETEKLHTKYNYVNAVK